MGIVALAAMTLCSCEDLLDTKNYTQSNTQNFPTSMDDVEMLVTSMYANLNHQAAKPESSYLLTNLYASDDMFAGSQDAELDHLMYRVIHSLTSAGIFTIRASMPPIPAWRVLT